MADILADYREWRDQQAARVSTHSAGCHMWHRDCMIHRLADALGRARLTDEEREAIEAGIFLCEGVAGEANENINAHAWAQVAARLRGLLERAK